MATGVAGLVLLFKPAILPIATDPWTVKLVGGLLFVLGMAFAAAVRAGHEAERRCIQYAVIPYYALLAHGAWTADAALFHGMDNVIGVDNAKKGCVAAFAVLGLLSLVSVYAPKSGSAAKSKTGARRSTRKKQ